MIGIDVGITLLGAELLGAENLRSRNVWRWFMRNKEILRTLQRIGFDLYKAK